MEATIAFWVKRQDFDGESFDAYSFPYCSDGQGFGFFITDAGNVAWDSWWNDDIEDPYNLRIYSPGTIANNEWRFVAGVSSNDGFSKTMKLYIDGNLVNSDTLDIVRAAYIVPSQIRINSNQAFDFGQKRIQLDSMSIWGRALSDAEITQLYNGGAGLDYPSF